MKRVQILTVSTAPRHKYQQLQKKTAKKWGYSYVSLGQGQPWEGFVTKMELPLQYLQTKLADYKQHQADASKSDVESPFETLYVVVDAYDLIFAGPPEELLQKYIAFGAPLVTGSERICFGNCLPSTCDPPDRTGTTRQYINTGFIAGPVEDLIAFYSWGIDNYPADDQVAIAKFRNAHCNVVALDRQADIVLNYEANWLFKEHDSLVLLEGGRFRVKQTGTVPCIIHCPFIFQDLGRRWEYVLGHALPEYVAPGAKGPYFHSLVQHTTKQIRTNKTYFVFTLAVCYASILFLVAFVCSVVYAFRRGKTWMERFEYGV